MQQIADHIARSPLVCIEALSTINRDIRAVKWSLWHGHVDYAIRDLEQPLARLNETQQHSGFDLAVAQPRRAAPDLYALEPQWNDLPWKRYRSRFRIIPTLAESAVNSLIIERMVKKQ